MLRLSTRAERRLNWKTKAAIQRAFARLPFGSESAYYQLQRRFGNLRHPESPLDMFRDAATIFAELESAGRPVKGARVMEVGTGHRLNMPFAFYLAGAKSIYTLDLYPILKRELVMDSVAQITEQPDEIVDLLKPFADADAVGRRLRSMRDARSFEELKSIMRLRYFSPTDATNTGFPDHSVDIHFSYTVFEHVPGPVLVEILREASRLISKEGLICHHIDLSDHYSHSDRSINRINFLRFSADEWRAIDNPRFGYQNRLRAVDYQGIYAEAGQRILRWVAIVGEPEIDALRSGFPLAPELRDRDPRDLCTVYVRAISRPA